MYFLYKVLKQEGFGVYAIYGDLGTRRPLSHRMKMVAYYQQHCSKSSLKSSPKIEIAHDVDNVEELSVTFFPDCFIFSAFDHSFEENYPKNTAEARDLILSLFLRAKCLSAWVLEVVGYKVNNWEPIEPKFVIVNFSDLVYFEWFLRSAFFLSIL